MEENIPVPVSHFNELFQLLYNCVLSRLYTAKETSKHLWNLL